MITDMALKVDGGDSVRDRCETNSKNKKLYSKCMQDIVQYFHILEPKRGNETQNFGNRNN